MDGSIANNLLGLIGRTTAPISLQLAPCQMTIWKGYWPARFPAGDRARAERVMHVKQLRRKYGSPVGSGPVAPPAYVGNARAICDQCSRRIRQSE